MSTEKGIFAESNEKDFEQVEPGSYIARAYKMIDIGTQRIKDYATDDIVLKHEVMIYWEILEDEDNKPVRMQDGRPFSVQRKYKLSMHPKSSLRKDLDAWRGQAFTAEEAERFNVTKLLGTYCRINLTRSENGKYTNVTGINFTKRKPEGINEVFWWSAIDPDRDMAEFEKFPDWLKDKIASCEEWQTKPAEKKEDDIVIEEFDDAKPINLDEIPF